MRATSNGRDESITATVFPSLPLSNRLLPQLSDIHNRMYVYIRARAIPCLFYHGTFRRRSPVVVGIDRSTDRSIWSRTLGPFAAGCDASYALNSAPLQRKANETATPKKQTGLAATARDRDSNKRDLQRPTVTVIFNHQSEQAARSYQHGTGPRRTHFPQPLIAQSVGETEVCRIGLVECEADNAPSDDMWHGKTYKTVVY